jgi:iron(III) transport system substrate-binding protein
MFFQRFSTLKSSLLFFTFVMLVLLLLGCNSSTSNSSTESSTSNTETDNNPPSSTISEKNSTVDDQQSKEDIEWEQIVEAAKKEGVLYIASAPGEAYRTALTIPFQEKYPEIEIKYTAMNGSEFWPRMLQERSVDKYLWDISIIGLDAIGWDKGRELTVPIRPLMRPELLDDGLWLGGTEFLFMDQTDQYAPGFLSYAQTTVSVNRDLISEEEFSTPEQLLDPKFKGKIVIKDPRTGAGLGSLAVLLAEYGEDFVRDFLTKQDVVVTKDNRQIAEWVIRGKYPIGIGFDSTFLPQFQEQGVGLNVKEITEGPQKLSRGFSATSIIKDAPNPNAARVYINWLYSQEGQSEVVRILKLNSTRLDVPPGDENSVVDPAKFNQVVAHQIEELYETRKKAQKLAKELIKQ